MSDHPLLKLHARRRIYDAVGEVQGIPASYLVRALGVHWWSLTAHLDRLVEAGLIEVVSQGRLQLLFRDDAPPASRRHSAKLAILLRPTAFQLAAALLASPCESSTTLALRTSLPKRTVQHNLKHLREGGLVVDGLDLCATPVVGELLEPARRILEKRPRR